MKRFKKTNNKQLGELLIERGIITREQVQIAVEKQKEEKKLFGEILVDMNFATERDIAQALICQYGFPFLPLENYDIDPEVIRLVPEHVCRQFTLIPIDKIGKSLTLAMSNPLNNQALEDVSRLTECVVQTFVSTTSEINQAIGKYYS